MIEPSVLLPNETSSHKYVVDEESSKEYIIRHVMSSPVATIDPDSTV